MITAFINIRFIDIIDILLVAVLMYQLYLMIKGTAAFSIFIAILAVILVGAMVKMFNMKLLSSIIGTVISGGAIALIIVFQQEIRRLLIHVGTKYFGNIRFSIENLVRNPEATGEKFQIESIQKACATLSKTFTGALIVITRKSSLNLYTETGDVLNANLSSRLLESIFVKDSPLHDGAVILDGNRIIAARCVLPFTSNSELPPRFGMRHRAGLGISENTDALVIVVSEERGSISIAENGKLIEPLDDEMLGKVLRQKFGEKE
ncbi:MAG: diadenylate cyclase CdaA [Bacteroidales bacterium]|nr:diadenylate cyclase CdaA [Bacteroidales bacterium]